MPSVSALVGSASLTVPCAMFTRCSCCVVYLGGAPHHPDDRALSGLAGLLVNQAHGAAPLVPATSSMSLARACVRKVAR